ncbi:MAG: ATP-binding protein, partial [Candidatus Altiarchaeota archaeon]
MAGTEAFNNAVGHGHKGDQIKQVLIGLDLTRAKARISITDEGDGFDVSQVPDPLTEEEFAKMRDRGRGIMIMRELMDSVYHPPEMGGRQIVLENTASKIWNIEAAVGINQDIPVHMVSENETVKMIRASFGLPVERKNKLLLLALINRVVGHPHLKWPMGSSDVLANAALEVFGEAGSFGREVGRKKNITINLRAQEQLAFLSITSIERGFQFHPDGSLKDVKSMLGTENAFLDFTGTQMIL